MYFSRQREHHYLKRFFSAQHIPVPKSFIVYTPGYLGKVDFVKDEKVLVKTLPNLESFHEICPDQIVLIKPHFNTDLFTLEGLLRN